MITLYHNPRCSKSRQALILLQEKGIEPNIKLYLDEPPSAKELKALLSKLGIGPRALLRKGEDLYKTLQLNDETLTDTALIKIMVQHPKLIERPIVIKGDQAIVARPPENLLTIL